VDATPRIGTSGWNYPHWRGAFYPDGVPTKAWLAFLAQRLSTVEVNGTFYSLTRPAACDAWRSAVPPDFLFAVKGSRYITHMLKLRDFRAPLANFFASVILRLGAQLGPVLWQLPATFRRNDDRLAAALAAVPPGRHCFEFRHPSWFVEPVYELLRAHGAALVIGDRPEVKEFQSHELTSDWTYVRFHYGSRGRRGNYSERELEEWARRFEEWSREVEVLAYFNNDWEVFAIRNARWLKRRLST
jgi:uncharacterized protein YecE (DUF72 family)